MTLSPRPTLHVIANPGARLVGGLAEIERAYEAHRDGVADLRVEICRHGEELPHRAREAARSGASAVVAAGGDGTISAVASALVGGDVPLGVLPMGTRNHFAIDAGLPIALADAAATTAGGFVRRVDVGRVNDRTFVNTATLGVYFDVVKTRDRWRRRVGKTLATIIGMLHALRHPPVLKLDVTIDGEPLRARVPVLWAGNNRYALQWPDVGRRQRLDEGIITLVMVHDTSRTAFAKQVLDVLLGRTHLATDIDVRHPRQIVVDSRTPHLRIALDGETLELRAPLRISVEPVALPLLVPR